MQDPKPHVSIGWMLGDQRDKLDQAIAQLVQQHQHQQQRAHAFTEANCFPNPAQTALPQSADVPHAQDRHLLAQNQEDRAATRSSGHDHQEDCDASMVKGQQQLDAEARDRIKCADICSASSISLPNVCFPLRMVVCKAGQREYVILGDAQSNKTRKSCKR